MFISCNGGGGEDGGSTPVQKVLPMGNFAYSDGTTYGIHASISNNGNSYTITHFSIAGNVYQQEIGTVTYSGNEVTFHTTSSIPFGCMSGTGTWKFSNTNTTVTLEATQPSQAFSIIVGQRVLYDVATFVGGTATTSCWN